MELLIKLPDACGITEDIIKKGEWESGSLFDTVLRGAVMNGQILPKGHGRLVDEEEVTKAVRPYVAFNDLYDAMKEVHTVVEPDYINQEEDDG